MTAVMQRSLLRPDFRRIGKRAFHEAVRRYGLKHGGLAFEAPVGGGGGGPGTATMVVGGGGGGSSRLWRNGVLVAVAGPGGAGSSEQGRPGGYGGGLAGGVCADLGTISLGYQNTEPCPACSGGDRVLYLEPEIEQDEGSDVTVRAWTADGKSSISYIVRDTNVLVIRTRGATHPRVEITDRLTHAAFVRLNREGWMDHEDFLSLLDLYKSSDLELVDHHRHAARSEPKALGEILAMASAAYHARALLDRAIETLQSLAAGGNEIARDFLEKNKEGLNA